MPLRKQRSSSDIIAGVDFLTIFMRNAEERYYPLEDTPNQPFDILDDYYQPETTTKRPRFSISTKSTTTTTTEATTTTRKPKLSVPTLPTIRKIDHGTSEASSNVDLRTALPPITNHDVYKYIRRKSNKPENKFSKEDNFTEEKSESLHRKNDEQTEDISTEIFHHVDSKISSEVSVQVATEKSTSVEISDMSKDIDLFVQGKVSSETSVHVDTEKSVSSNTEKELRNQFENGVSSEISVQVDSEESTSSEIATKGISKNQFSQNEVSSELSVTINTEKSFSIATSGPNNNFLGDTISSEVSVQLGTEPPKIAVSFIEPSAIVSHSNNDDFIIEESEPLTIDATDIKENVEKKRVNREDESSYQYDFSARLPNKARSISYSAVIQIPNQQNKWEEKLERKNLTESVAETKDYYVTRKYENNWEHTTEKNWGTTEKNWGITPKIWGEQQTTPKVWGVQQTTPKVWGTTEKNWGETPKIWGEQQTTPKVWGVQQTTPKIWGVQQTTPKVWGVQQTTPKVWGVQQQPWGTTEKNWGIQQNPNYGLPEQNYEVDENDSIISNGRIHGVQKELDKPLPIKNTKENDKVGYVVEGRDYRKYRVEERTSDGFIVGEYGVVSNNDGSLRGVRYTADGTINPSVIYDALMKFLSL